MFIFSTFTGLSYADLKKLSLKHIITEDDGGCWISTSRQKTKTEFDVKLLNLPSQIMGEIAISFDLSNEFFDEEGSPASLMQISKALENAFNFTFGDIYKTKVRIFVRKPYNLTKALDYLKNLIVRENRNKKMKKDEFVNT